MPGGNDSAIQALDALIAQFQSAKRLRVWSVVITVFGDAVIPRGGMIGLAALQELTSRMGVAPGALRAALSRLAKDGWVERFRHGRRSYYSLSGASAQTSIKAGARFYAPGPPTWNGRWTLALAPEEPASARETRHAALSDGGFVRMSNGLYLRPDEAITNCEALKDMFVLDGRAEATPEWVLQFLSDPEVAAGYAAIVADFTPLDLTLAAGAALSPLDATVARTLLIHDWRRVVLRDVDLPLDLRPCDWPGEEARALVRRLYARLLEPSERWLDTCDGRPDAPLPKPGAMLERRFRSTE
jgi:phenylacetic acid degradation operon negative regulatory protein